MEAEVKPQKQWVSPCLVDFIPIRTPASHLSFVCGLWAVLPGLGGASAGGQGPTGLGGVAPGPAPPRPLLAPLLRDGGAAPPADPKPQARVGPLRAQPGRFWLKRCDRPGSS